jgi:hypothetical protein
VTLPDFWIYRTEVSNQQYKWCVTLGGCTPPNLDDNPAYNDLDRQNEPVVGVSWDQGQTYCKYFHARYPTEAEWEKAARGPDANKYPWGNNEPTNELLNYNGYVGKTTFVTDYDPQGKSYYDALNMAGNVWEWVADWYGAMFYKTAPADNPIGPQIGTVRSVRSTGYKAGPDQVAAAVRFFARPTDHRRDLGFRCVVEDPTYFAPFCKLPVQYGNTSGGNSTSPCDPASIVPFGDCGTNNTPINNVHLESPSGTTITSVSESGGTCIPPFTNPPDTAVHVCPVGVTITITQSCDPAPDSVDSPGCPSDQYDLSSDGTSCIPHGGPGSCLEGFTYDSTLMCCQGGSPQCAAGYIPFKGACVPDNTGLHDLPDVSVKTQQLKSCGPGDGGQPDCSTDPLGCPPSDCGGPNQPPCGGYPSTGCLAAHTLIDTPTGPVAVEDLHVGDAVWTADANGVRTYATVLKTQRLQVPASHEMMHLVLLDGRELFGSPTHPTADGRTLGDLSAGDMLDGVSITIAERLPYGQPATYDLLPSGSTGTYWANGILIGSTLTGQ